MSKRKVFRAVMPLIGVGIGYGIQQLRKHFEIPWPYAGAIGFVALVVLLATFFYFENKEEYDRPISRR